MHNERNLASIFIVNSNNKTQITVLSTDNNKVDVTNYAVICNGASTRGLCA